MTEVEIKGLAKISGQPHTVITHTFLVYSYKIVCDCCMRDKLIDRALGKSYQGLKKKKDSAALIGYLCRSLIYISKPCEFPNVTFMITDIVVTVVTSD